MSRGKTVRTGLVTGRGIGLLGQVSVLVFWVRRFALIFRPAGGPQQASPDRGARVSCFVRAWQSMMDRSIPWLLNRPRGWELERLRVEHSLTFKTRVLAIKNRLFRVKMGNLRKPYAGAARPMSSNARSRSPRPRAHLRILHRWLFSGISVARRESATRFFKPACVFEHDGQPVGVVRSVPAW